MKNITALFAMLVLAFTVVSCSDKSNDPTPTNQNVNNGNNTPTFTAKTIEVYYKGELVSEISQFYMSADQANLTLKGSLMGFKRVKNGACIEPNDGLPIEIIASGRYYFEARRGWQSTGFTMSHAGYIDVTQDGVITLTQTAAPSGTLGVEFNPCSFNEKNRITIHY